MDAIDQHAVSNLNSKIAQLESSNKVMAQQILEKQEQLEKLTASRNSIQLLFENANQRCISLEQQLQQINSSKDVEAGISQYDQMNRSGLRARNRRLELEEDQVDDEKHIPKRSVKISDFQSIVSLVDSVSTDFFSLLRRKPEFRRISFVYLLLLHLWVLFVLFHFGRTHGFKKSSGGD